MNRFSTIALLVLGLLLAAGVAYLATLGDQSRGGGDSSTRPANSTRVATPSVEQPIAPSLPLGVEPGGDAAVRPPRNERIAAPIPTPVRHDAPPTFQHLRGSVVTAEKPLEGALVLLLENETPVREARSAADGSFELKVSALLENPRLQIVARGYATHLRVLPALRPGESRLLGNLRVDPAKLVRGVVRSPTGTPVLGAEVLIESAQTGRGQNHAILRTTSGADGSFRIPDAMPGDLWVTARAAGFGEGRVRIAEGEAADVSLDTESVWSVLVTGHASAPLTNARVELTSLSGTPPIRATTGTDGRATLRGLGRVENVRVSIAHDEYWPTSLQRIELGAEATVALRALPTVSGFVQRADRGALVPGTQVRLAPAGIRTTDDGNGHAVEALDGSYVIKGVTPGRWVVEARAPGFSASTSEPFIVRPEGDTSAPPVVLRRGGIVELLIEGDGAPIANANIELYQVQPDRGLLLQPGRPGSAAPTYLGASNGDGKVVLREVAPGSWWAIVRADGWVPLLHGPLLARDDERLVGSTARLERGGTIAGLVTAGTDSPLTATIQLSGPDGPLRVATEADGSFSVEGLRAGSWSAEAHAHDGRSQGPQSLVVTAGESSQANFDFE